MSNEIMNNKYLKTGKNQLYVIYVQMKRRCYDYKLIKYASYKEKGIKVSKEFNNSFIAFVDFMINDLGWEYGKTQQEQSIHRINNNLGYKRSNIKLATAKEQANNTSRNQTLIYEGKQYNLNQLALHLGINRTTLASRMKAGTPLDGKTLKAKKYYHDNSIMTVAELCVKTGMSRKAIKNRIDKGFLIECKDGQKREYVPAEPLVMLPTSKERANVRSNNRIIIYKDISYTLSQLSEFIKMDRSTILYRLRNDISLEEPLMINEKKLCQS